MNQPTKERFLKDIKDHQIEIIKDDGVYRHIKCQSPDTWNMGFYIITFPGGLLYTGDVGTYEFERIEDMFRFFRSGIDEKTGDINISSAYWAEKCLSESIFGNGIKEFDPELFKERIKEYFEQYYEDNDSKEKETVWEEIKSQILDFSEDSEWSLVAALNNFSLYHGIDTEFAFYDFWDGFSGMSKTFHFIWCLYAIVWTIQKYDEIKS